MKHSEHLDENEVDLQSILLMPWVPRNTNSIKNLRYVHQGKHNVLQVENHYRKDGPRRSGDMRCGLWRSIRGITDDAQICLNFHQETSSFHCYIRP